MLFGSEVASTFFRRKILNMAIGIIDSCRLAVISPGAIARAARGRVVVAKEKKIPSWMVTVLPSRMTNKFDGRVMSAVLRKTLPVVLSGLSPIGGAYSSSRKTVAENSVPLNPGATSPRPLSPTAWRRGRSCRPVHASRQFGAVLAATVFLEALWLHNRAVSFFKHFRGTLLNRK